MHRLYVNNMKTMKKHIIPIISLLALALFSCGGETQINIDNLNISVETPAIAVEVDTVPVAEQIFKEWHPDGDYEGSSNNLLSYECSYDPGCEGCYSAEEFHCYPLENGGYLVVSASVFAGPGCAGDYSYGTWTYKDGVRDTITGILPSPELELLLNPEKTEPYKAEIADFKEMYDKAPWYYQHFYFNPPQSLNVELYPYDCEETYPGMGESMLSSYDGDKTLKYLWDGKKFVKE